MPVAVEGSTAPPRRAVCSAGDKFDSGTGWPSFKAPIDADHVEIRRDVSHGMVREEVIDARSGAHLGHVFSGEGPSGTARYCINSGALVFVARADVDKLPAESRPVAPPAAARA